MAMYVQIQAVEAVRAIVTPSWVEILMLICADRASTVARCLWAAFSNPKLDLVDESEAWSLPAIALL